MMLSKGGWSESLEEGIQFVGVWFLSQCTMKKTKNDKSYWIITIKDRTGDVDCRLWDAVDPMPRPGRPVKIQGLPELYRGEIQVKIQKIRELTEEELVEADPSWFVPVGPNDRFEQFGHVERHVASMGHAKLRSLVSWVLEHPAWGPGLRDAPAANSHHHCYVGGLVDHVLSMIRVAKTLAGHYDPLLNEDLLVAACVFHDIGKVREQSWSMVLDYTPVGRLVGHVPIGLALLMSSEARAAYGEEDDTLLHLTHVVASHHGQLEWGATKVPASREASVFHLIDMVDSRMGVWDQLDKKQYDEKGFGEYSRSLETNPWKERKVE